MESQKPVKSRHSLQKPKIVVYSGTCMERIKYRIHAFKGKACLLLDPPLPSASLHTS